MEGAPETNEPITEKPLENYLLPYQEIPEDSPTSYFFSLTKGKRTIDYFGVEHSYDPEDPIFDELHKCWSAFMDKTKGKNCALVIEGGRRPPAPSLERAIKRGGELSFIRTLAARSVVPAYSPEPSPADEIRLLQGSFPKDHIAYYYLMRMIPQWHRYNPPIDWQLFLSSYLKNFQGIAEFQDLDFSLENMAKIHQNLFGNVLDLNKEDFFYDLIGPRRDDNPISKIASKIARLRDESAVKFIAELWKKKKSVFIVYGSEHAIVQEPALRQLVK